MSFIVRKGTELLKHADIIVDGSRDWDIQIKDQRLFSRILSHGTIALGESYVDGWWTCKKIDLFIYKLLTSRILDRWYVSFWDKTSNFKTKLINFQTRKLARENAEFHYNMGNKLFEDTLDPYLQYSCGYWKKAKSLNESQIDKMDLICKKLGLKKGMKILDIGCGWGGFARFVSKKYGVSVVGLTLSEDQAEYAREKCKNLPIEIKVEDYRAHNGKYDRIVCIEMMEHVGPKNHRVFMDCVSKNLKNDGLFLLQAISISKSVTKNDPWIDTYMFPGSVPLSANQITKSSERIFYIQDWHNFGPDYHKTMIEWNNNFLKNKKELSKLYDPKFLKQWEWYLLCCPGTAIARTHHLWQVVFSKINSDKKYTSVR